MLCGGYMFAGLMIASVVWICALGFCYRAGFAAGSAAGFAEARERFETIIEAVKMDDMISELLDGIE